MAETAAALSLFSVVGAFMLLIALIMFFVLCSNVSSINKKLALFFQYYYRMEDYKRSQETLNPALITLLNKPIDEKLSMNDYILINREDSKRFMAIAEYFHKNDTEFYSKEIMPVFKI